MPKPAAAFASKAHAGTTITTTATAGEPAGRLTKQKARSWRKKRASGSFIARKNRSLQKEENGCDFALRLYRTGNLTRTHATGAGVDVFGRAVYKSLHTLDIGLERPVGTSVRVGHLNPKNNALAADIAFCHPSAPPLSALVANSIITNQKRFCNTLFALI